MIGQLLEENPDVDARSIHVEVKDASVTLSGAVPDRWTKSQAEELIALCVDVKEVHNELLVRQQRC